MRKNESNSLKYIKNQFAIENENMIKVRNELQKDNKEGINISPVEGHILKFLAKMINAKKIVEIGSLYGYSALWFLEGLSDGGELLCFEDDPKCCEKIKELLIDQFEKNRIRLIEGDALTRLKEMESSGPFDLIFIDADKASYWEYAKWAEKNISQGGLIIGDNTFLFGHMYNEGAFDVSKNAIESMNKFNTYFLDKPNFQSMMLPTSEGLTVIQKIS